MLPDNDQNKIHRRSFLITGRVQGVFYRKSTEEKALNLHLSGFVKNLEDGSVYVEAQGNTSQIQSLYEWCLRGPELAKVDDIKIKDLEVIDGDSVFKVKR